MNIGVTGLAGSGKSTVSKFLAKPYGLYINADDIAHEALNDEVIVKKLVNLYGEKIYQDGVLQRSLLAEIVFNSKEELVKLEEVIHPYVREKMKLCLDKNTRLGSYFVVEVPLLVEKGFSKFMDINICVEASFETRYKRVKRQRNWSKKDLINRDLNQNVTQKKEVCDFILDSDAPLYEIEHTCKKIVSVFRYFTVTHNNSELRKEALIKFFKNELNDSLIIAFNEYARR